MKRRFFRYENERHVPELEAELAALKLATRELAKTVQRALDEYLAPQGVHTTAFTAALAQPAIVALLRES
jgi:hypothetical protein